MLAHLPEDTRAKVGHLLNLADEIGREPAAVLLLGFDVLVKELAAAGVDVTFWTDPGPTP